MNAENKISLLIHNVFSFLVAFLLIQYSCKPTGLQNEAESSTLKNEKDDSIIQPMEEAKVFAYPNGDVRSNLLFRKEPTRNSEIIGRIPRDSAIGIIKKTEMCETIENVQSCWYRAIYHDTIGYVFGGYLWFRTLADLNVVDPPQQANRTSQEPTNQNEYNGSSGVAKLEMQENVQNENISTQQYDNIDMRLLGEWYYKSTLGGQTAYEKLIINRDGTWSLVVHNNQTYYQYGTWRGEIELWLDNDQYPLKTGRIENDYSGVALVLQFRNGFEFKRYRRSL